MKHWLAFAALTVLLSPAQAQTCGIPGVSVSVSPQPAAPGETIHVTLTNGTNQPIDIGPCFFPTVYAGPSCGSTPVAGLFSRCFLAVVITINPGESRTETWDQRDNSGQQVPEGVYSLKARYAGSFVPLECCISFTICSNATSIPTSYCTAGTSASGCRATLSAFGTASPSRGFGFVALAAGVEDGKDGLFFYGQNGRKASPWGNGTSYQCVAPPVRRGGLQPGVASGSSCSLVTQDLNARWCSGCPKPDHAPVPGQKMQLQFWYRDPTNTSNRTSSLSDALEADVCP